jgi:TetR/AcrR family acrAB operon transcriptional repressor
LDAACGVFTRKGLEAATMAEIATEAGISPGAIYRYFENKEELARGCMSESSTAVEEQWKHQPEGADDPMREFNDLSIATFGALNDPRERINTMLFLETTLKAARTGEEALRATCGEEWEHVVTGISSRLALAQERGQIPLEFDLTRIAGVLYCFYWGARLSKLILPEWDTDGQLHEVMRLMALASRPIEAAAPA